MVAEIGTVMTKKKINLRLKSFEKFCFFFSFGVSTDSFFFLFFFLFYDLAKIINPNKPTGYPMNKVSGSDLPDIRVV